MLRYVILDSGKVFQDHRYGALPLEYVKPYIIGWANEVKKLEELPDLWEERSNARRVVTEMQRDGADNAPFTPDEQKQIAAQLQEIKKQLRERFELSNEQIEQIDQQLDKAAEARGLSETLQRKLSRISI